LLPQSQFLEGIASNPYGLQKPLCNAEPYTQKGANCLSLEPGKREGVPTSKTCMGRKRGVSSSQPTTQDTVLTLLQLHQPGLGLARSDPARPVQHCPANQHLKLAPFSTPLAEGRASSTGKGGKGKPQDWGPSAVMGKQGNNTLPGLTMD